MAKALGMVETLGVATSIEVADAMLKAANVHLLGQKEVSQALYTILIEGDVSAVQEAVEKGAEVARRTGKLITFKVIPRPIDELQNYINQPTL